MSAVAGRNGSSSHVFRLLFGCLLPVFFSFLSVPAFAAEPAECSATAIRYLPKPGQTLAVPISGGETHCYRVPEDHGGRLVVIVHQRGTADTRFDLPDDQFINSPLHYAGDEIWFSAANGSSAVLRVTSKAPRKVRENYSIQIEWLEAEEAPLAARHAKAVASLYAENADRGGLADELSGLSDEWKARKRTRLAAQATHIVGWLLQQSGSSTEAVAAFSQAADLYRAADDPLNAMMADSHRAMLFMRLTRFDAATKLLAHALEQQRLHHNLSGVADTLNNFGLLHHYQGKLEQARDYYNQAAALNEELDRPHRRLAQLNNLGGIHFVRGEAVAAADAFREAIRLGEQLQLSEPQAAGLGNLGLIQMNAGAYLDALATYTRLLEIYRNASIDPLGEARTLDRIGQVYVELGDPRRGIDYLEQARDRRVALDDRRGLAQTWRHLADAFLRQENLVIARDAAEKGLALQPTPGDAGKLRLVLGRVLMRQGDFSRAVTEFENAAEQLEAARENPGAAVAKVHAAEARVRDGDAIDENALRELLPLLREARFSAGEIHLDYVRALHAYRQGRLDDALAALDAANAVVARVRDAIALPELRASYAGSRSKVLDLRVAVLMALHAREPQAGHAVQALLVSERAKARGLLELLQNQDIPFDGQAAKLTQERRALLQRINFRISQRGAASAAEDAQLAEWRAHLDVVDAALAETEPLYAALVEPEMTNVLPAFRRLLGPRDALVHYHLGEHGSYVWTITPEGLSVRELPAAETVKALVLKARDALERRTVPSPQRDVALQALADAVWQPSDIATNHVRLFIVADGALHLAPFAALPDESGEPLAMRHILTMLPSMNVGLRIAGRPAVPPPLTVALVGDPVYDATDARLVQTSNQETNVTAAGRLPATARELGAVATALPAVELNTFMGFAASPELIREPVLAEADIVHFAVHGVFDDAAPALSGLLLSRFDAQGEAGNGFVGLRDIYALDWKAALVVLSGCETARGRQLDGVGVIGMTGGFLAAGAAQTVASLWRIPDAATAEFMRHFYAALERLDAAAALRDAQLAMRADRRFRHPYFWSGFVAHGMAPAGESKSAIAAVSDDGGDHGNRQTETNE